MISIEKSAEEVVGAFYKKWNGKSFGRNKPYLRIVTEDVLKDKEQVLPIVVEALKELPVKVSIRPERWLEPSEEEQLIWPEVERFWAMSDYVISLKETNQLGVLTR